MKRLLLSASAGLAFGALVPAAALASTATTAHDSVAARDEAPIAGIDTIQGAFDKLITQSKGQMIKDPSKAAAFAESAEALAKTLTTPEDRDIAIATALWLRGEASVRTGQPEKGADIIDRALELVGTDRQSTKLGGDLLLARGRIAGRLSDVQTAVDSFFKAHDVFVAVEESRNEAMVLQAIGSIYRDAQSYPQALDYYRRANEVYGNDKVLAMTSFNNQANTLRDMGNLEGARDFFAKALTHAQELDSDVLQGRILNNLAEAQIMAGDLDAARASIAEAKVKLKDDTNREWRRFTTAVEAHIALEEGDKAGALAKIEETFDGLTLNETNMSFEEMHKLAYDVYLSDDNHEMALNHHQNFKRLSDEAKKVAASSNLALLGVQFNVAQQDLNIERLRNERMKSDVLLAKAKQKDVMQVAITTVCGIVILFFFTIAVNMHRTRNKVGKINSELQTTVDQLHNEIDRREVIERDLVIAKDDAEQANRLKSTFLATMSHELRTPMNGVLGFSKILLSGDLTTEQREQVSIIQSSGESLLCLINDILDISQIEAGKMNLSNAAFNLRNSVEAATKLLQPKAQEKGLNLAIHIDPDLPTLVMGDSDRIRQIVVNLLGNAIKFTENGSVAVFVGRDEGDENIKISVVDTGVGIPSDKVEILFDRFSQVDGSSTRKHDGSGLGLAICKELTDAMGGQIGVKTELGEGSEFFIAVPLANAEEMDVLPREARTLPNNKRVVVVDDLAINQKVFGLILNAMNAEHVEVGCAEDTIHLLMNVRKAGEPVDAIVISDTLTTIRSYELLEKLQRNNLCGDARMILSAPGRVEDAAMKAMGFDAQIEQPITDDTVFSELRSLILNETVYNHNEDASSEVISLAQEVAKVKTSTRRVLVAEDNLANKRFVSAVLGSFDVETDIVMNGADAVEAAKKTAYDLILMDVHMPIMNGVEATKRIRAAGQLNAETTIVALTAVTMPGDHKQFINAGMDDVLPKPLELASLRSKIAASLDRAQPQERSAKEYDPSTVVTSFDRTANE
ncbi:MAG: ATP-binding protein [Pseudomonadota bacterium]